MENNFKTTLDNAIISLEMPVKAYEKPQDNMYFQKYIDKINKKDSSLLTLREIFDRWNYSLLYPMMIETLNRFLKDSTDRIAIVSLDMPSQEESLKANPMDQKVFSFRLYNKDTGRRIINGGIILQNGTLSLHS